VGNINERTIVYVSDAGTQYRRIKTKRWM